ncbi:FAD binding domain-containing protein [Acetobacteraceae bacterium H6797]|nr:FAD binding domain-containing protein [Acetobacteraceae bacterium H6797]
MKPAAFAYERPATLAEALALKARHGDEARFIAGGQSLVPAMNFRMAQPGMLIDVGQVEGLDTIAYDTAGTLTIGARARYRAIERHPEIIARHPLIPEALHEVAHPQIRNRGTLAGNCCHADPASEMPMVMLTLGARFLATSAAGERLIEAADFFLGALTTALSPEEMLARIAIPPLPDRCGTAFLELSRRKGDYAMMGVAAVIALDADGRIAEARLGFCNAGITPRVAPAAAALLKTQAPEAAAFAEAASMAQTEIEPGGTLQASPDYQRHLAGVLARRALAIAASRASETLA